MENKIGKITENTSRGELVEIAAYLGIKKLTAYNKMELYNLIKAYTTYSPKAPAPSSPMSPSQKDLYDKYAKKENKSTKKMTKNDLIDIALSRNLNKLHDLDKLRKIDLEALLEKFPEALPDDTPDTTLPDKYGRLTKEKLIEMCKDKGVTLGIPNFSKLKKDEIIDLLVKYDNPTAPPTPKSAGLPSKTKLIEKAKAKNLHLYHNLNLMSYDDLNTLVSRYPSPLPPLSPPPKSAGEYSVQLTKNQLIAKLHKLDIYSDFSKMTKQDLVDILDNPQKYVDDNPDKLYHIETKVINFKPIITEIFNDQKYYNMSIDKSVIKFLDLLCNKLTEHVLSPVLKSMLRNVRDFYLKHEKLYMKFELILESGKYPRKLYFDKVNLNLHNKRLTEVELKYMQYILLAICYEFIKYAVKEPMIRAKYYDQSDKIKLRDLKDAIKDNDELHRMCMYLDML